VVNRAQGAAEANSVADRMINVAGQFLFLKLDYLGFIYDDRTVPAAVRSQRPFMVSDPKCRASVSVQHLAERMDKSRIKESGGIGAMFKKMFSRS
jgi:flagellar biosynthesis protein FlhG